MKVSGTTLTMIRGDSECFTISIEDGENNYILKEGDTVYFSVKKDHRLKQYILQKIITDFPHNLARVEIHPIDTVGVNAGDYVYDVQLTKANGEVKTIIEEAKFVVKGDVTHD